MVAFRRLLDAEVQVKVKRTEESGAPADAAYLFGDLLALAREQWVRRMAALLAERGYPGYRRTDALLVRLLRAHGAVAVGGLARRLGVSRQAARKLVDGLERRGYAGTGRDEHDARVVKVALTAAGEAYAGAVVEALRALNRELAAAVDPADLAAADRVLRAALTDPHLRAAAARVGPPGDTS